MTVNYQSRNGIKSVYALPGARINFFNGSSLRILGNCRYWCEGTVSNPVEFHFYPSIYNSYGSIIAEIDKELLSGGNTDTCWAFGRSSFKHCIFVVHNGLGDETMVSLHNMLQVEFDSCTFIGGGTGIAVDNMSFPQGDAVSEADVRHEIVFKVNACTFQKVATAIEGSSIRDFGSTSSCEFTDEDSRSCFIQITNNRISLREHGSGIRLNQSFLDRFNSHGFCSRFFIEGNVIEGVNNAAITSGIEFLGNCSFHCPDGYLTNEYLGGINFNYIMNAIWGINIRVNNRVNFSPYPSCESDAISIKGNIIYEADDIDASSIIVERELGMEGPNIGSNVLRKANGTLGTISGDPNHYTVDQPNIATAVPEDYEANDYHYTINDIDFLHVVSGCYNIYPNYCDIGVYGGGFWVPKEQVYHIIPDQTRLDDDRILPSYKYMLRGVAVVEQQAGLRFLGGSTVVYDFSRSNIRNLYLNTIDDGHIIADSVIFVISQGAPVAPESGGMGIVLNSSTISSFYGCKFEELTQGIQSYSPVQVDSCFFEGCYTGLVVGFGSNAEVKGCSFTANRNPLIVNGGYLIADNLSINNNSRGAFVTSHAMCFLSKCDIFRNGEWGLLANDGYIRLYCSAVYRNSGPGVIVYEGATVDMGVLNWEELIPLHNMVANNYDNAQIVVYGSLDNLILDYGENNISGGEGPLVDFRNSKYSSGLVEWRHNYWGYFSENDILHRLATAPYDANVNDFLTTWDVTCTSQPTSGSFDNCATAFKTALYEHDAQQYTSAKSTYREIIDYQPTCELSLISIKQFLNLDLLGAESFNSRDYLRDLATSYPTTDMQIEAFEAAASIATADDKLDSARTEYDSLLNWATDYNDSSTAMIGLINVNYFTAIADTGDTLGPIARFKCASDSILTICQQPISRCHFGPFLEHTPVYAWTANDDSALINCAVYEEDSASTGYADTISVVKIFYRFYPSQTWIADTLDGSRSDSTYSIVIPSGTNGGAIEYQIIAQDSRFRLASFPEGNFYWSDPDSNRSHFVSFEPRVTTLTDTAYIYAPGRITNNIEIQRGGLLYIRPLPVDSNLAVVIDSGITVNLTYEGTSGDNPRLIIEGTSDAPITMTCADTTDNWSGVVVANGWLEVKHAEIERAVNPIYVSEEKEPVPVIRLKNVSFNSSGSIIVNNSADVGSDSSYLNNVTIENISGTGLLLANGSLDFNSVIVRNCSDNGVVVQSDANLTMNNCIITENIRSGLILAESQTCTVYANACQFTYNGDTLPEISIEPGDNFLELGDGRCNMFRDSSGMLLYAYSPSSLHLEYGSNQFIFNDSASAGAYIMIGDSSSALSYITDNYFGPIQVQDSLFANHLGPQNEDAWIYSYLRLQNMTDSALTEPTDTINVTARAFIENYVGTASTDTLQEVVLKWRLFPDSMNWTTSRLNGIAADSTYLWDLLSGSKSTLVSYIFWTKDSHGRYVSSPLNADTTDPDSGNTHITSLSPADTVLYDADTMTIWAPTVLNHSIYVNGGTLFIKPWPGAANHTVTLGENVFIFATSNNTRGEIHFQGTASMPITLGFSHDSSNWTGWHLMGNTLLCADYTQFRSAGYVYTVGGIGPVVRMSNCAFDATNNWIAFEGLERDSSYLRSCTFRNSLSAEGGIGFLLFDGDIEMTDCWVYNNKGVGLWMYNAYETEITGSYFIGNEGPGLYSDGYTSTVTNSCSQYLYNGGDSTAEVVVNAGDLDFSNNSNCVFADYGGPLLEGSAMSCFALVNGENGFYLFDSTGQYIITGDETDTLDVTNNYWYPFGPDTSAFWNHLDPDTMLFWISDSAAAAVGSCGESSSQYLLVNDSYPNRGRDIIASTSSVPSTKTSDNWRSKNGSAYSEKSSESTNKNSKTSVVARTYMQGVQFQREKNYAAASQEFKTFITTCDRKDPRLAPALSHYYVSAHKANIHEELSNFFLRQEQNAVSNSVRIAARLLYLECLMKEGRASDALDGFERIIMKPTSQRDSVQAVIGAMRVHFFCGQKEKLSCRYPENRVSDFRELIRRMIALTKSYHHTRNLDNTPVNTSAIPTEYKLYQNYPNPFNPNTEIQFDLPEMTKIQLKIFNILGQEVTTLVDEVRPAGAYRIMWDSKSASGITVASGVYVYQIKAGNFVDSKKMVLIR
ncbi:T9SS C-terminal target domain-containing protein [candidate division KSB1 bacterium]|nr:MAG: T9SS C-terminal target domain-containing protein [candidate division KSB1 bacterium]